MKECDARATSLHRAVVCLQARHRGNRTRISVGRLLVRLLGRVDELTVVAVTVAAYGMAMLECHERAKTRDVYSQVVGLGEEYDLAL
jgi:hypothetical protein